MFGYLKRRRYEKQLNTQLRTLMGESGKNEPHHFAHKLRGFYPEMWEVTLNSAFTLGYPIEITALNMACQFYEDMLGDISDEEMGSIRMCILENDQDPEKTLNLLLIKIKFTTYWASQWVNKEIKPEEFQSFITEIHTAIFGNENEHRNDTLKYFLEGGNQIAKMATGTPDTSEATEKILHDGEIYGKGAEFADHFSEKVKFFINSRVKPAHEGVVGVFKQRLAIIYDHETDDPELADDPAALAAIWLKAEIDVFSENIKKGEEGLKIELLDSVKEELELVDAMDYSELYMELIDTLLLAEQEKLMDEVDVLIDATMKELEAKFT